MWLPIVNRELYQFECPAFPHLVDLQRAGPESFRAASRHSPCLSVKREGTESTPHRLIQLVSDHKEAPINIRYRVDLTAEEREELKRMLPVLSGSEKVRSCEEATALAEQIGFPVILKAAADGGGRGMKIIAAPGDMRPLFASAAAEARTAFGDDTLYLEKFIANARHIEVQLLGDRYGNVIHLGERDCSLQRRHQKVVEEAPAPVIAAARRAEIH